VGVNSGIELVFVWMPLVCAGIVAAVLAVLVFLRRRRGRDDSNVVSAAHTDRMVRLPEYRRAYRRVLLQFGGMALVALVALGAFSITAARPITTDVADTDRVNRDIVLCLDVSGSMLGADSEVLERFKDLVAQFRGERIALVVWDSSAAQVFPLNDDYTYVQDELANVGDDTGADIGDLGDLFGGDPDDDVPLYAGTGLGDGSSLIGDGLASCVLRFDNPDLDRSRTIILATDNELAGNPIVTLREAASFAIEQKVRVYGIMPGGILGDGPEATEMQQEVGRTGGKVFSLGDADGGNSIVDEVLNDQATALTGVPELVVTDHPGAPFVFGVLALWGVIILGWRLRS
jgi:Ca-activated chloride channel family protein